MPTRTDSSPLLPTAGAIVPPAPPAVLVVGSRRAGQAFVARALADLGLALPKAAAEAAATKDRPSRTELTGLSDEILRRLGSRWDDPPPQPLLAKAPAPPPPELQTALRRATRTFETSFGAPGKPVCWADPGASLLLPFWRRALDGDRRLAAVLCLREPLAAARSLDRASGLGMPVGLALWERYNRRAVEGLAGVPVFVSVFEDTVADPGRWRGALTSWLETLGIATSSGGGGGGGGRSDRCAGPRGVGRRVRAAGDQGGDDDEPDDAAGELGVDDARGGDDDGSSLLWTQRRLYDELAALSGPHRSFDYSPAFAESPWTADVLEQRRDQNRFWHAADWLAKELVDHLPEPGVPDPRVQAPYPPNATTDQPGYERFLRSRGEAIRLPPAPRSTPRRRRGRKSAARPASPLFSVILTTHRPSRDRLACSVGSVLAQTFNDFELCVCDDASGDPGLVEHLAGLAEADRRITLTARTSRGGVATATNDALSGAGGRYVVLLGQDDALHPSALGRLAKAIDDRPDADLLYCDEDAVDASGFRSRPRFKPEWSPDLLLSGPYTGAPVVARRGLIAELGGLRPAFEGAEDYDVMLRATERTDAIVHVPEVLYHSRAPATVREGGAGVAGMAGGTGNSAGGGGDELDATAPQAGRRALEEAVRRRGITAAVEHHPSVPGNYHVRRRPLGGQLVSAIIPFRDEPALTAACYRSFIEQPGYEDFELLLVDNDSALPETAALLEEITRDRRVRVIPSPGSFDWVAINNAAAKQARGDLLLFMNNDVEARSPDWLSELVAHATRPEVGAVGARLCYPDGTVQHAGVAIGLGWGATHLQQGLPADEPGYLSLATVTRNCSAVTGACLMTRREVFEEVGGYDSGFPIAFNDIDFCLRLRERGFLVVYTPLAELVHHESKSIGHTELIEAPLFRRRWRSLMVSGDPYYNPNLGRFDNSCRLPTEEDEGKWATFLSMLNASSTS